MNWLVLKESRQHLYWGCSDPKAVPIPKTSKLSRCQLCRDNKLTYSAGEIILVKFLLSSGLNTARMILFIKLIDGRPFTMLHVVSEHCDWTLWTNIVSFSRAHWAKNVDKRCQRIGRMCTGRTSEAFRVKLGEEFGWIWPNSTRSDQIEAFATKF